MALSSKQLAMAWINSKLEPDRINPEFEEFMEFDDKVKEEKVQEAQQIVRDELAKIKERFQAYVDKYVNR